MAGDTEVRLETPEGWEVSGPVEGARLVAIEPPVADGAFRTNLVLTSVPVGGLSFRDWQRGSDEILARALDDYLVIDLELLVVEGRAGGRRLAHYAGPGGAALTLEQWFVLVGDVGHTLTATVASHRYDELADRLAAVATSWHSEQAGLRDAD